MEERGGGGSVRRRGGGKQRFSRTRRVMEEGERVVEESVEGEEADGVVISLVRSGGGHRVSDLR